MGLSKFAFDLGLGMHYKYASLENVLGYLIKRGPSNMSRAAYKYLENKYGLKVPTVSPKQLDYRDIIKNLEVHLIKNTYSPPARMQIQHYVEGTKIRPRGLLKIPEKYKPVGLEAGMNKRRLLKYIYKNLDKYLQAIGVEEQDLPKIIKYWNRVRGGDLADVIFRKE
jgi:hypothetical protein